MPLTRSSRISPATFFLITGLILGGLLCVFIPFGAGFDEETHLVRIYDISGLNMLPNRTVPQGSIATAQMFELSYQRRYFLNSAADLFNAVNFQEKNDWNNLIYLPTRSIYSPVIFFPQAFVAGVFWRVLDWPVIPVAILCRLAGLLVYLAGGYLAIRWLPVGKWLMALLALSPMALFQAATLNADGFTNAASFLFFGYVFKLYADSDHPVTWRQVGVLTGLMLLLGLAKPGAALVLPLALLLPRRRFASKKQIAALWLGALLALAVMVGWSVLSVAHSHFAEGGEQSISDHLRLALANPLDFAGTFFYGAAVSVVSLFKDWVGVYGHWVGVVPGAVYPVYLGALLLALFAEPKAAWFTTRARLWTFLTFLVSAGGVFLLFYLANYNPGDFGALARQGRYFIPTAPLLYLSLAGLSPLAGRRLITGLAGGLLGVSLALYGFGLYATYYSLCASTLYTGKTCVQPVYKNLDKASLPAVAVDQTSLVEQTITPLCGPLTYVDVLVKTPPADADGVLHFSLLDSGGGVLGSADFHADQMTVGAYLRLRFKPAVGEANDGVRLRLESPDFAPGSGPLFAYNDRDYYHDGRLSITGASLDGDLIFHYACAVGK